MSARKVPDAAPRLVWARAGAGRHLDGAWWPRSRDAAAELRVLLPAVEEHLGSPVTRVSLSLGAWEGCRPDRLLAGDRTVRLGWSSTLEAATATFGRSTGDRIALRVVAPDVSPAVGETLMAELAASTHWPAASLSPPSRSGRRGLPPLPRPSARP